MTKLLTRNKQITRLKDEINKLQSEGKIFQKTIFYHLQPRARSFLVGKKPRKNGSLTPDDIAITGLKFKRKKLVIKGIALTFEDRKDFEIIDEYVQTLRNNKSSQVTLAKSNMLAIVRLM